MASENQKLKLLYLARIFMQETDADHGLTRQEIEEKLRECDIKIERKTFYDDIKRLNSFGFAIEAYSHNGTTVYSLISRDFEETELLLLADAIQSSKFLTTRKSAALMKKITKLGSTHNADALKKHIYVEGRIKNQNESVFYNLDAIHRAIAEGKKVVFRYFKYGFDKKRIYQHNGDFYTETPVQLMYMDDYYYLIAWNEKHQTFVTYRVDRMRDIDVSPEPAIQNEQTKSFDVAKFQQRVFGMFSGEAVNVTLRVKLSVMSSVVDRFGKDVICHPLNNAEALVKATVMKAPTFYGWLTTFGNQITIEEPATLKTAYLEYLDGILKTYKS